MGRLFALRMVSLVCRRFLVGYNPIYLFICLLGFSCGVLPERPLSKPMWCSLSLWLSCDTGPGLNMLVTVYSELTLGHGARLGSVACFAGGDQAFSTPFIEKLFLSSLCVLGSFVKHQLSISNRVYFRIYHLISGTDVPGSPCSDCSHLWVCVCFFCF